MSKTTTLKMYVLLEKQVVSKVSFLVRMQLLNHKEPCNLTADPVWTLSSTLEVIISQLSYSNNTSL